MLAFPAWVEPDSPLEVVLHLVKAMPERRAAHWAGREKIINPIFLLLTALAKASPCPGHQKKQDEEDTGG
jgi:hypothetical protein